jgi:hypothetical protein
MNKLVLALFFFIPFLSQSQVTDSLPNFTVRNVGNGRIIVGWNNRFDSIRQISIQRSFDSIKGYKTIMTVPDPTTPQNGFVDSKATNDHMFYRLFILLDRGVFLFSPIKKPVLDTTSQVDRPLGSNYNDPLTKIPGEGTTVPNLGGTNPSKTPSFVPSNRVFTSKDGFVRINLPDASEKKYSLKFFEENGNMLFELKEIRESSFKIDKSNFYHGGWFNFELYDDGKLVEKYRFYLLRDF